MFISRLGGVLLGAQRNEVWRVAPLEAQWGPNQPPD
jgi:hypothetical protein